VEDVGYAVSMTKLQTVSVSRGQGAKQADAGHSPRGHLEALGVGSHETRSLSCWAWSVATHLLCIAYISACLRFTTGIRAAGRWLG